MVFNLVIPGGVGGDLIKAAYLVRMQIKKTQAIASMVIDRILGLLGLFILAAIAGAIAWGGAPTDVRTLIVAAWLARGHRACSSWSRSSPRCSAGFSRSLRQPVSRSG